MKKATTLIILMMWMVNTHFYAAPISVKKAQEIAESMSLFSSSTRQSNVTLQCIYTPGESTRSADVYAPYYVFGPQNNSGFVIISGDDELHSLVGYSVDNTFDIDKIPVQLQALLSDYAMYVAAIQSGEVVAPDLSKRSANGVVVAPMITTKWDQSKPYNDLCTPYYTGCVATAMAQIMNYHKWPAQANATLDNMPNDYRVTYERTIDWDNMLDEYNQKWNSSTQSYEPLYNAEQANAVANLMTVCGVAVRMGYGTKASSAFSFSVANALRKFLKYSPKIDIHERNNYLPDEWIVLLRSNLEQNMPFMYSGFGNGGGHAFVCDGIDAQDLLHINWGWSGYCDGYFDVCYMSPSGVGIGGGTGDFNKEQDIISGIRPLAADEIEMTEIPRTLYISEYSITSDLILSKNDVNNCFRIAMGRVSNYTDIFRTESFAFGIAVVDKDGNVKSLNSQSYSFKHASYRNLISYNLIVGVDFYDREKKAFFPNGDYEIIPVMCNFDGDQPTHISQFIKMRYNGSSSDIKATITDTEIILHQDNQFTPYDLLLKDIIIPSKLYANYDNEQIVIKVENKGTTNYEGNLEAYYIHESIDDSNIYVALSQPCSWGTGCAIYGNKEIDVYLTMPQLTSIGKYKIRVFYKTNAYDKEEISSESTYYITISEAPNSPMVKMELALYIYYSK